MVKKLALIIYKILTLFDFIFFKITKRTFVKFIYDLIRGDSYSTTNIMDKKIKFFAPNPTTIWRVKTLFTKEPETIEWIDSFEKDEKIIFWDIGANIGLYSIYAALKHKQINVFAFEASAINLGILTRNISINSLSELIIVNQFPLTDKENEYLMMRENSFEEGGSQNSFGEKFNFEGKNFLGKNNYKVYGTTINYLLKNNILEIPNYIKIDVDGIEHLILRGAKNFLNDKRIKSMSIEINENFKEQHNEVLMLMKNAGFVLKHKKQATMFAKSETFSKIFNHVFEKNIISS